MDDAKCLTDLLNEAAQGNRSAEKRLLASVYDEMRERAKNIAPNQSLEPTALVHEIWMRLFHGNNAPKFENRRAFYGYATRAMRNLLVDHLRRGKRGKNVSIDLLLDNIESKSRVSYMDLETALNELATANPRRADIVQMRFFVGLSMKEIADELEISLGTVERDWRLARATLRVRLLDSEQ